MNHLRLLFLTFILISCGVKSQENELVKDLDVLFGKEFKEGEPGGSILVKKGDKITFKKSYGLEDLGTGKKITENTVFNTGSISKTFVSNGILILKERGLLDLEDSITKYFPDFNNPGISNIVKIKHLLSHTSGLPDSRRVAENKEFFLTAKDKENWEPLKSTDSLNFESGAQFQYSNPGYNGLALIIEQTAKQPWQDFITENIFNAAGMTNSKITNGSYPDEGVAHAYIKDEGGQYIEYDYGEVPTFAAAGNGGVWSTVLELASYENTIQANAFLSKDLIDESRRVFRPQNWSDTLDPFVGYSWFVGLESLLPDADFEIDIIYHTGSQGGFRAFHILIPEHDILFVGLFNRPISNFRKMIHESISAFKKNNWMNE